MPAICATELKYISPIVTNKSYVWYMPAVLLTVGIALISLWEAPQLPPPVMSLGDKVLHGLMYTALAVAWMVPITRLKIEDLRLKIFSYTAVCLAVTAFGALMEVLQRFCTLTRSGEMADVYADFIGALVGVLIVGIWRMAFTTSH